MMGRAWSLAAWQDIRLSCSVIVCAQLPNCFNRIRLCQSKPNMPLGVTIARSVPWIISRSKPLKTPVILSPKRCINRDVDMASSWEWF